jgi:hypothetical protein
MSSTLRGIADSLAAGLSATHFATLSAQPTIKRKNLVSADLKDFTSPVVIVQPAETKVSQVSRTHWQIDFSLHVFIGRQVATESDIDAMLDFAEEMCLQLRSHSWGANVSFPDGVTSPVEVDVEYNPGQALSERNIWRAMVGVTYRVFQANYVASA